MIMFLKSRYKAADHDLSVWMSHTKLHTGSSCL